ncbi:MULTISPECIES: helix-turn-helix domain-containing protein [unclassified Brevibacterium]|uniref:winged helix-turn-helix transcriptional regulator n=1 Tax=unclassified Brevibacterium TaxID=2614124 RepID=UPI0010F74952|nr:MULTISPECIES: helix-turn-helix domain-containing protein [unclassified Brevibacterium]MCM1011472.1 helix-turn-helix transcriptional regulator [Brevibacterium sp. XM4083]
MPRKRVDGVIASWSHNCAAEVTVAVLGGAWKPVVLSVLGRHEVMRFGELRRAAGEPTPRVLTRQLRELEEDGLISRTVYAEVPPRVEYRLTARGRNVQPLLDAMAEWGRDYAADVERESADDDTGVGGDRRDFGDDAPAHAGRGRGDAGAGDRDLGE